MKIKKLLSLGTLSLLLSMSVSAQSVSTSTTSSTNKTWEKIKENTNFLLYVGLDHLGTTDTYTGYSQTNIGYLTYNLTGNDSLRLETRVSIRNPNGEEADTRFSRTVLRYRRSNILTQEKNGINLSASFEKRYIPDAQMRSTGNSYGLNRFSLSASRTINDLLSVGATAYVAVTDVIDSANEATSRNYFYLVTTQTFSLPKGVSLTMVEEVFKNNNKANTDEYNSFDLTAEFSKSITDKVGGAFYVAGTPISSTTNNWDYNSKWTKSLRYGLSMTYSAF